jgi:hypothetical protein
LNTTKLLLWSAVLYVVLLVLVRGFIPPESAPTISLLGIPLIVIVVMIARDLARRSTIPTVSRRSVQTTHGFQGNPVQFLRGQFKVAANASNSYFQNVVQSRLREMVTAKVALETGLDSEAVRPLLSDPVQGPALLEDEPLYRMLYGPPPKGGLKRINMIGDAIDLIGAWKG